MEKLKEIKLDDYVLFSQRPFSFNYHSKDNKYLLKTFTSRSIVSIDSLKAEKALSDKMVEIGVPTPKAIDIVTADGNIGMLYEYVPNKISIARAVSENWDNRKDYLTRFVNCAKKMHATHPKVGDFREVEDLIWEGVKIANFFSEEEVKNIKSLMAQVTDERVCILRDFNLSNIITSDSGEYVIDVSTVARGPAIYDVAFLFFFCFAVGDSIINRVMHMNREQCIECFNIVFDLYYGDKTPEEKEKYRRMAKKLSFLIGLAQLSSMDVIKEMTIMREKFYKDTYLTDQF